MVLSRDLPPAESLFGYMEVWASFRTRTYHHLSREWTVGSFPPDVNFKPNSMRRALVSLPVRGRPGPRAAA